MLLIHRDDLEIKFPKEKCASSFRLFVRRLGRHGDNCFLSRNEHEPNESILSNDRRFRPLFQHESLQSILFDDLSGIAPMDMYRLRAVNHVFNIPHPLGT